MRERRLTAIRPGEDFRAVVGSEHDDRVIVLADVLELLHHKADVVVQLGHSGFFFRPAIFGVAHRFIFRGKVRDDVHAGRVEPDEERLVVPLGFFNELEGEIADLVVHGLHALGIERAGIFDFLLADWTPARHVRCVIRVGGPTMHHISGANYVQQILRIVGMRGIFHGIQVIQIAEEFVKSVNAGQEFIFIAQVIFAELTGGVTHPFQNRRNRHSFGGESRWRSGLADGCHASPNREFTGDEVRATRGATRFRVIVGEQHALFCELVEVRSLASHQAAVVGADVPHADVVAHYHEDVGFLLLRGRTRR